MKATLLIILIGLIVYANTLVNGFVWEDEEILLTNQVVHSLNLPAFFTGGSFSRGGTDRLYGIYYRPIMTTVLALQYSLFGTQAWAYHLSSVILHIGVVWLLFKLFEKFFSSKVALLLALVFLVHPLNSESVSYITSNYNLLYMLFGLLALHFLSRNMLLAGGFLLLALLNKETGGLFLVLSVVLTWLTKSKATLKVLGLTTIIAIIYISLRLGIAGIGFSQSGISPILHSNLTTKLTTIPAIFFYYLKSFVLPLHPAVSQHWIVSSPGFTNFFLPLMMISSLLVFFIYWAFKAYKNHLRTWPGLAFFGTWASIGLTIHTPLVPIDMTVSDRWFYFPLVGLLGIVGIIWGQHKWFVYLAIVVIILFSVRTIIRNTDWKDNLTLASHDIRYSPNSFELHNFYGIELAKAGDLATGEKHLLQSIQIQPYGSNLTNLGSIYMVRKDYPKALDYFHQATQYGYYKAYENLASVQYFHGDIELAKLQTEQAIALFPTNSKLWYILALVEQKRGDLAAAKSAALKYQQLTQP